MCAESFCKNFHLDDSGISLPAFPARIKLKMHNISITLKLIEKVIINLDLSKGSGTLYIPLVVRRKYESELSYILAELFSMGLWEFNKTNYSKNGPSKIYERQLLGGMIYLST